MAALCRSQCVSSLRTCGESAADDSVVDGGAGGSAEIMLFGVRVKVDPMRKSVSLNNLSQYELPNDTNKNNESAKNSPPPPSAADEGYASADDAVLHQPSSGRERKRGVPWTEEEHKLFLLGLQKVGKGDWRGISRNFVKTRTPTQVASHAQKYFLRRSNLNRRRRRRSSLFDITTDSVAPMSTADVKAPQENSTLAAMPPPTPLPTSEPSRINPFSVSRIPVTVASVLQPVQVEEKKPIENLVIARTDEVNNPTSRFIRPVPIVSVTTNPSAPVELNLNQGMETEPSSLSLSLSLSVNQRPSSSFRHPMYPGMSSFNNGDTTITVSS